MKKRLIVTLLIIAIVTTFYSCKKENEESPAPSDTADTSETSEPAESETSDGASDEAAEEYDEYQAEFAAFVDEQYKTSIEESYYITHTYYKNPEASGINMENVDISMGLAPDKETMEEDRTYYNSLMEALKGFDRDKLTRLQQDEYDSLEWEITSVLEMAKEDYDYYNQVFSPPNSLDANIFSMLSTWELFSEKDAQDVITFIDSMPEYVDSYIEYAKKQQELELLMTNFDDVITSTQDVLDKGTDTLVIKNLHEQVDNLTDIDDTKKAEYKDEITKAYERSFIPSFENIVAAMEEMKGGFNNTLGYASLPNGKEYYNALLNYTLGSTGLSCKEIKSWIQSRLSYNTSEFRKVLLEDPESIDVFYEEDIKSGYTDYVEILEDVKVKMLENYPEVKDLEYNIEPADPEERLSEKNVGAYFLVPPIDESHLQQMRVNPDNEDMETVETYITVCHEGFPGHMYQFAYMADHTKSPYIRTLEVDSMIEGYAVYSQYNAIDYLDLSDGLKAIYKANDRLGYLEYSLVDLGINYEGWTIKDTLQYFNDQGYELSEDDIADTYNYLRGNPGSYFQYGPGYEFIAELRQKAEKELGTKFDEKAFNEALLNAAPTPRNVVTRYIDEYIKSAS